MLTIRSNRDAFFPFLHSLISNRKSIYELNVLIEREPEVERAREYVHVCRTEPSLLGKFPIPLLYFYPTTFCVNSLYQNILINLSHVISSLFSETLLNSIISPIQWRVYIKNDDS